MSDSLSLVSVNGLRFVCQKVVVRGIASCSSTLTSQLLIVVPWKETNHSIQTIFTLTPYLERSTEQKMVGDSQPETNGPP